MGQDQVELIDFIGLKRTTKKKIRIILEISVKCIQNHLKLQPNSSFQKKIKDLK